jgi:hypothetical protein
VRNVYALFDYGDFIEHSSNDRGDPYVQFLSITDMDSAFQEFNAVRAVITPDEASGSISSSDGDSDLSDDHSNVLPEGDLAHTSTHKKGKKIAKTTLWIIIGCVAGVALLFGLVICACCCGLCGICRRGSRDRRWKLKGQSMPSSQGGQYSSLNNPKDWEHNY